jgi:hypothetical protein
MTRTFDNIWISSVGHLESFGKINKSNSWLKSILGRQEIPSGFPQIGVGSKNIPLVYFVKGTLQLYERQIEFHPNRFEPENGKVYRNLDIDFRFELPYDTVEISVYTNPKPFIRAFNIQWLKLSRKNNEFPPILISTSGKSIAQIIKENEKLLALLTAKIVLKPELV